MKRFEVVTHEEASFRNCDGPARAVLAVLAGIPAKADGLVPLAPGVVRGVPVVVVKQSYGDLRTSTGTQLQAIRPDDARRLAWALMEAADAAESPEVDSEDLQASKE